MWTLGVERRLLLAGLTVSCLSLACGDDAGPSQGASDAAAEPPPSRNDDPAVALDSKAASDESDSGSSDDIHECRHASDCPQPEHPGACAARSCNDGRCSVDYSKHGTELAEQTAHDCRKAVCDGEGNPIHIDDDGDVADDDNACTEDSCKAGSILHMAEPAGTACAQHGGKVCSGDGDCVGCAQASDCKSNVCQAGVCRPPLCGNRKLDSGEADIDCGGSCGPCGPNQACTQPADCAGMECAAHECVPNCSDGIKNNDEPDSDCGAACPTACANGKSCAQASDCASGFCHPTDAKCVEPVCNDGFINGDEMAMDCGGSCPACPVACEWSDQCGGTDVCYPNVCVHSVNGCSIGTAIDLRGMDKVTIEFDAEGYTPNCILVTMYTQVTFNGDFAEHPLAGGQVKGDQKSPATDGPFVPVTNSGTSKTFAMDSCAIFPFYCDQHAAEGKIGTVFVVAP